MNDGGLPALVELPLPGQSRFWQSHVEYVTGTLHALPGTAVRFTEELKALNELQFAIRIDGRQGLLDIRDFPEMSPGYHDHAYILRLIYSDELTPYERYIPIPTISFHDWNAYAVLAARIQYTCRGETILANFDPRRGEPNHGLTSRRLYVQGLLRHVYGERVELRRMEQQAYWSRTADSLVLVHVPGATNNVLDRSQLQFFGLGGCTISPVLQTYLSTMPPMPWEHYVPCLDSYDDLIEKIEWCRGHRAECVRIGQQARHFFRGQCLPQAIWTHVKSRLSRIFGE